MRLNRRPFIQTLSALVVIALISASAVVVRDRRAHAESRPGRVSVTFLKPDLPHTAGQDLTVTMGGLSQVFGAGDGSNATRTLDGSDDNTALALVHDTAGNVAGEALVPKITDLPNGALPVRPTYASTALAMLLTQPGIASANPLVEITLAGFASETPELGRLVSAVTADAKSNPRYVTAPDASTLTAAVKAEGALLAKVEAVNQNAGVSADAQASNAVFRSGSVFVTGAPCGNASAPCVEEGPYGGTAPVFSDVARAASCDSKDLDPAKLRDVPGADWSASRDRATEDDQICFEKATDEGDGWHVSGAARSVRWPVVYDVTNPDSPGYLTVIPGRTFDIPNVENLLVDAVEAAFSGVWAGVKQALHEGIFVFTPIGQAKVAAAEFARFLDDFGNKLKESIAPLDFDLILAAPSSGARIGVFGMGRSAGTGPKAPLGATIVSWIGTTFGAVVMPGIELVLDLKEAIFAKSFQLPSFGRLLTSALNDSDIRSRVNEFVNSVQAGASLSDIVGATVHVFGAFMKWAFETGGETIFAWLIDSAKELGLPATTSQLGAFLTSVLGDLENLAASVVKIADAAVALANFVANLVNWGVGFYKGDFLDRDFYVLGNGGQTAPGGSAGKGWVALGDGFSSGDGTPLPDATPYDPGFCRRSNLAWPRLLDRKSVASDPASALAPVADPLPYSLEHEACSRATISDMYQARPPPLVDLFTSLGNDKPEPAQLSHISKDTGLVSLTIGLDDVGLDVAARTCAQAKTTRASCVPSFVNGGSDTIQDRINTIGPRLTQLYEDVADRAPDAKIAVVGYPVFFPERPVDDQCPVSVGDVPYLRAKLQSLNSTIAASVKTAAGRTGGRVVFVDMADVTSGHEFCTAKSPQELALEAPAHVIWMNPVTPSGNPNDPNAAFLLNALGNQAMAKRFRCAVVDCSKDPGGPGGSYDPKTNVHMAIVIDNSPSIYQGNNGDQGGTDPDGKRFAAVRTYLATALPGDLVSAISFSSDSTVLADAFSVPEQNDALGRDVEALTNDGSGTNIRGALETACKTLAADSSERPKAVLLFTDGVDDDSSFNGDVPCLHDAKWPVFGFRLFSPGTTAENQTAGETVLHEIAADTGGRDQPVTDVNLLACLFQQVRAQVVGAPAGDCTKKAVTETDASAEQTVSIDPRHASATFSASWNPNAGAAPAPASGTSSTPTSVPGPSFSLEATSPSGATYRSDDPDPPPGVQVSSGKGYALVQVPDPVPGAWRVSATGSHLLSKGNEVVVSGTQVPVIGTPPIAVLSIGRVVAGRHHNDVAFDARRSSDRDGAIATYVWDFGDSSSATGAQVTHAYTTSGTFTPVLTVIDRSGDLAVARGKPITIDLGPDNSSDRSPLGILLAIIAVGAWLLLVAGLLLFPNAFFGRLVRLRSRQSTQLDAGRA